MSILLFFLIVILVAIVTFFYLVIYGHKSYEYDLMIAFVCGAFWVITVPVCLIISILIGIEWIISRKCISRLLDDLRKDKELKTNTIEIDINNSEQLYDLKSLSPRIAELSMAVSIYKSVRDNKQHNETFKDESNEYYADNLNETKADLENRLEVVNAALTSIGLENIKIKL